MSTGKLPSRGDLLNIRGEMAKRRRFIRRRAGDLVNTSHMKNNCPTEVNFDTNGTPYNRLPV